MGLDSNEFFEEMYEHRDMEDSIGIQVQVLNTVVLEKTLEEIAGREG
jgi:uridylate kinase